MKAGRKGFVGLFRRANPSSSNHPVGTPQIHGHGFTERFALHGATSAN